MIGNRGTGHADARWCTDASEQKGRSAMQPIESIALPQEGKHTEPGGQH
jgi:hypothetical protein